jgi:hypothetical protein
MLRAHDETGADGQHGCRDDPAKMTPIGHSFDLGHCPETGRFEPSRSLIVAAPAAVAQAAVPASRRTWGPGPSVPATGLARDPGNPELSRRIPAAMCSLAAASASASATVITVSFGVLVAVVGIGALIPDAWGAAWPVPCGAPAGFGFGASVAGPLWPETC